MTYDGMLTRLRRAQALLQEVRDSLDKRTEQCPTCGHVRSVDQEQRTMWEMVNAAVDRCCKVTNWVKKKQEDE